MIESWRLFWFSLEAAVVRIRFVVAVPFQAAALGRDLTVRIQFFNNVA
jgi:hypothetical protein